MGSRPCSTATSQMLIGRPCSTSYENNGKSQVSHPTMKADCSAGMFALHLSSTMGRPFSTTSVAGCRDFTTRTALPFRVHLGSLSRLVASSSLSKISVPILQPHRLHLLLRWQDETHLLQNKWRHSRFELSRCGGAPH